LLDKLLASLPESEQRVLLDLLEKQENFKRQAASQNDFLTFVKNVWPSFIEGRHHKIMAEAFNDLASGKLKRLIVNMPPRHTKSEFASYLLPAWYLGKYPEKKVIMASHTAELATGFGRKVRNLVDGEIYNSIFPKVSLQADNKAAGRWNTSLGGEYFAIGVGGAVTGKGADLFIIDDPHSEQDAMIGQFSQDVYDKAWDWYVTGPRQRLQPGAAVCVVMTRWSKQDMTGRLIQQAIKNKDLKDWRVIQFPALLPSGEPTWPGFWSKKELEKVRDDIPTGRWQAQYQQDPTAEEGAIIKRDWWRKWERSRAPECSAILASWDTAHTKKQRSDYSACTTWGIFHHPDTTRQSVILLDAFREKLEFPELKQRAKQHYQFWQPDMMLIEAKAAGLPLVYELRAMGLPVQEFTPVAGEDKIVRANAVSDMFASGMVYAPETKWAAEVIEECAEFPNGDHDDYVDTTTQALIRIRKGGLVNHDRDDPDAPQKIYQHAEYY
jgi:predicted phage terminase large subunit-like protein